MMRKLVNEMKNRKIDYDKIIDFGFTKEHNLYIYKQLIYNNRFEAIIKINNNEVQSLVSEVEYNEEYVLVDVLESQGEFVGKIRIEYEEVINEFINKCTNIYIFKSSQANRIIRYIREKYKDELEYLWEKFPNNAIWRNKLNYKWYGALLTISSSKLGIQPIGEIEIIDLRYQSDFIEQFIDNKKVFPGYHMNKKNWITLVLDGSINDKDLFILIDNSYNVSIKKA